MNNNNLLNKHFSYMYSLITYNFKHQTYYSTLSVDLSSMQNLGFTLGTLRHQRALINMQTKMYRWHNNVT